MATKQEKEQKNIKNIQFAWIGKDKNKNELKKKQKRLNEIIEVEKTIEELYQKILKNRSK